jgi:hypothetical protein
MVLEHRWMQQKDLRIINKHKDKNFINLLSDCKTVAHVFESKNLINSWIVYKIFKKSIRIINFGFNNESTAKSVIEIIKNRFEKKPIVVVVSEYDLKFQMILKEKFFLVSKIIKKEIDFYVFVSKKEKLNV